MNITLADNRIIWLTRLRQWPTYYGMLAGIPYRENNNNKIARIVADAQTECLEGLTVCLIPPVATPESYRAMPASYLAKCGITAGQHAEQWRARHYESLPAIVCIGHFDSGELDKPGSEPFSSMVIVWFQNEFAMPIDASVLTQIERLDWNARAKDWMW